ncbi:hypothetical protein lerEdw1_020466 [Lerista edwardsae]|nr:hypothetical protein lerEdw1_020466 [Lerista edwardsae]
MRAQAGRGPGRGIKRRRDGEELCPPVGLGVRLPWLRAAHAMARISGRSRHVWSATWLLLLLGHVCPQTARIDNREICLQPPIEGTCRALISRWHYDKYTQTCKTFFYGGCEGNSNNFLTQADCFKTCGAIKKVPKHCRLDADEGICRALLPRYFFNLTTMRCEKFYYGGCAGNENRFDDELSCMEECLPKKTCRLLNRKTPPSLCYKPKDEGLCNASVPRFYYNIKMKKCEEFSYTGCGGNENNFLNKDDCYRVCSKGRKPRDARPKYFQFSRSSKARTES